MMMMIMQMMMVVPARTDFNVDVLRARIYTPNVFIWIHWNIYGVAMVWPWRNHPCHGGGCQRPAVVIRPGPRLFLLSIYKHSHHIIKRIQFHCNPYMMQMLVDRSCDKSATLDPAIRYIYMYMLIYFVKLYVQNWQSRWSQHRFYIDIADNLKSHALHAWLWRPAWRTAPYKSPPLDRGPGIYMRSVICNYYNIYMHDLDCICTGRDRRAACKQLASPWNVPRASARRFSPTESHSYGMWDRPLALEMFLFFGTDL